MISEHDRQVLSSLPVWNPAGDIAAQRAAWEELARAFNRYLPAIGDLDKNVELRAGLTHIGGKCQGGALDIGSGREIEAHASNLSLVADLR